MKTILILTMHGMPPKISRAARSTSILACTCSWKTVRSAWMEQQRQRYAQLNEKVRSYPRTAANDPFYFNSQEMAKRLASETGLETLVCFNEFCDPSMADAARAAVEHGAQRIIVLTPMMTRGGDHAEEDIPAELETLRKTYPEVEFRYAWPFDPDEVTRFLAGQVSRFA